MGLVDYSESESDSEAPQVAPSAPAKAPPAKKPFQKVVDRSKPGKIVVSLPQETAPASDEPPTKKARTGASKEGGRFSGFNSFLPPPKNAGKKPAAAPAAGKPRPGINLKTSAAPGFSRDTGDGEGLEDSTFAAPQNKAEPLVPEDQKPADQVKLVGKPMMFKPLSVSRNTNKKKTPKLPQAASPSLSPASFTTPITAATNSSAHQEAPPPKKVSLFSLHTEEDPEPSTSSAGGGGAYEPLFEPQAGGLSSQQHQQPLEGYDYTEYAGDASSAPAPTAGGGQSESLGSIADDLNLSAAERRQLFGRGGGGGAGQTAKKVLNFNMDREYKHNEEIRASGEQQIHNPVRSVQGGKHNLRQLVQNVQNQREALEDSFAKGKSNRKEASGKYGW